MNDIITTVIGGLILAIVLAIFGLGGTTRVVVHGGSKVLKTGKWIMIFSVIAMVGGVVWSQQPSSLGGTKILFLEEGGSLLVIYGFIFFWIGKLVAWIQKP